MCLVNLAFQAHPSYPLIVAANRDEYFQRPTQQAKYWDDFPQVLAGRDLEKGGTWMGVTKAGRFAALTNYREPAKKKHENFLSRGEMVSDYLCSTITPEQFLDKLTVTKEDYDGYNILFGDGNRLFYYSNKSVNQEGLELEKGIYSLSNGFLDSTWPKTEKGKALLECGLELEGNKLMDHLLEGLRNDDKAADHLLPNTGVGLELERMLSPLYIRFGSYGTRSSTIILLGEHRDIFFKERTYFEDSDAFADVCFNFEIGC